MSSIRYPLKDLQYQRKQRHLQLPTDWKDPCYKKLNGNQKNIIIKIPYNADNVRKSESNRTGVIQKLELINIVMTILIIEMMQLPNCYFITTDQIKVSTNTKKGQITVVIETSSIIGVRFVMEKQPIGRKEYAKIIPLLEWRLLVEQNNKEVSFLRAKFRTIGLCLLKMILGPQTFQQIQFVTHKNSDQSLTYEQCIAHLQQSKKKFEQILSDQKLLDELSRLKQKQNGVDYRQFLWDIFVDQEEMKWSKVIEMTVRRQSIGRQKRSRQLISVKRMMKHFVLILRETNQHLYQILRSLGLRSDHVALFLGLLSLRTNIAYEASHFSSLDDLLSSPNSFDFQSQKELHLFVQELLMDINSKIQCIYLPKSLKQPSAVPIKVEDYPLDSEESDSDEDIQFNNFYRQTQDQYYSEKSKQVEKPGFDAKCVPKQSLVRQCYEEDV